MLFDLRSTTATSYQKPNKYLVECAAHLWSPEDDRCEQVSDEPEEAEDGGEDAAEPELPKHQVLRNWKGRKLITSDN